jgi:regulator of replication initiation timing
MTLLEIVLIIIGVAVLIVSCIITDKSIENKNEFQPNERELSLAEIDNLKDKVNDIITEATENSLSYTKDRLDQLSNEKIIAVNDFSEQILEKISRNHEEVVFLYNMLNEKETEIKDLMKDFDKLKLKAKEAQNNKKPVENQKVNAVKNNQAAVQTADNKNSTEDAKYLSSYNQKILEMYSQGFSIIDISKTLELGQGEVKLVIDLYNNKKNKV